MDLDLPIIYIIACYIIVIGACTVGSFNEKYRANIMQSIALAMMVFWCLWRIKLVWQNGWGIPHEVLLATALLLHCIGSFTKTFFWKDHK